ncbi:efflux RND transporter permease subunit [Agarivorans sp. MS3-6]
MQQAWVQIGWLLLVLLAVVGLPKLQVQPSIQAYFSKDDPQVIALERFQQQYTAAPNLLLLLTSDVSWRGSSQQKSLKDFIEQLGQLSGVDAVSPYTLLALEQALPPNIAKQFVSEDSLNISLGLNISPEIAAQASALKQLFEHLDSRFDVFSKTVGFSYRYGGELALSRQYLAVLRHDLSWFAPALLLSFALLFSWVIRQPRWLLGMASCALISLLITLGLSAWMSLKLAAISAFLPLVLVSLAMAYSSHLYFAWRRLLRTKANQLPLSSAQAMHLALESKLLPLFWGALTTALGFLLLYLSPSPPIADFGLMVAMAVVINAVACYSILPLWVKGIDVTSTTIDVRPEADSIKFSGLIKARKSLLILVFGLSVVAVMSVKNLRFDDDSLGYFPDDNPFSQSRNLVQQQFLGMHSLRYLLLEKDQSQRSFADVSALESLLGFLNKQPEVRQLTSRNDWLDWLEQDPSAKAKVFALQQADVEWLKQEQLLTVWLQPLTSRQLIAFEQRVADWAGSQQINLSPAYSNNLLFAKFSQANGQAMLLSFAAALLLVALVVLLLRRSVYLMVLALLANGLPLLWVFALWQWSGQHLSLGSAVVMGMMLGIIVDDSLHILLNVHPASSVANLQQGMNDIIPALLLTSGALVIGFSLGALSDFLPIQQMSLLSSLSLVIALVFDLLLLPLCLPLRDTSPSLSIGESI